MTWMGTPFHHKGRVKGQGVDCGGFIYCVYSQFYQIKPFPSNYAEDWTLHEGGEDIWLNFISEYCTEINRQLPASLAVFKFGRRYGHGAICLGNNKFLHAWGRTKHGNVQISHISLFRDNAGQPRPVKYFDVRG